MADIPFGIFAYAIGHTARHSEGARDGLNEIAAMVVTAIRFTVARAACGCDRPSDRHPQVP